jgi:PKD repeat protein
MVSRYLLPTLLIHLLLINSDLLAQCSAGFNYSSNNTSVAFTSSASGNFNFITYDYGDGNSDVGINNPTHVYAEEGVYVVCQLIQDLNGGCFDAFCDTVFTENGTCSAYMNWFNTGLTVDFFNGSLGDYDSVYWSFGDGNASIDFNPIHTYASAGVYNVCLQIYSGGGLCDSICEPVTLDTVAGGGCTPDFTASIAGQSVAFTNLSTGNYNAQFWDFGDQIGTSTQSNPTYNYFAPGTYEVCLLVFDTAGGGCFDQICQDVTVGGGGGGGGLCNANFDYETNGLEISLENQSTGLFFTAIWDYGDGSFPGINGTYTYAEPGEYEVCLTILNPFPFCTDTYCELIEVFDFNCEPDFTYSFNAATNAFSFKNTTEVGNVTSVEWAFGDGNTSTFANPTYNYNLPGVYEVCLYTFDEDDLCGFVCKEIEVYPLNTSEFAEGQILVFPNPTEGRFSISNLPSGVKRFELRDLSGRLIWGDKSSDLAVDVNLILASGNYILTVISDVDLASHFRLAVP